MPLTKLAIDKSLVLGNVILIPIATVDGKSPLHFRKFVKSLLDKIYNKKEL